jgi:1,2-diacylglycerol 3-beta-glucosyltransferase
VTALETCIVGLGLVYGIVGLVLAVAASLARRPARAAYQPRVSVVLAARDEEANIGACIESLAQLRYPEELLEIVIVDDRSEDGTQAIARRLTENDARFRVISARSEPEMRPGKACAVMQGIEASAGEIVMLTDADCRVPPSWVEATVEHFADREVGIVAGFTTMRGDGWLDAIQELDWLYLLSVAAAMIRLRAPQTINGTNFSVRRSAYDRVGGHRGIPFSVTEDQALFHAITSRTDLVARFPMDARTTLETEPCRSLRTLHRQKLRWFTGGRGMTAGSVSFFATVYVFDLLVLACPLVSWPVGLTVLAAKCAADLVILLPAVMVTRRFSLLVAYPLFQLYCMGYVLVYPPLVLAGLPVVWKGRTYEPRG